MDFQIWFLPVLLLATATVIAFPLSKYMGWIMDGAYRPMRIFAWFERRLDSGFIPIIAPVAMAAFLGRKKTSPSSIGTLRADTPTFAYLLLGTVLIVGALLFLPIAALGPLAEHLGPIPFGG